MNSFSAVSPGSILDRAKACAALALPRYSASVACFCGARWAVRAGAAKATGPAWVVSPLCADLVWGAAVASGVTVGSGVGSAVGSGVGSAVAAGVGVGSAVGSGVAVGVGSGVAVGSAVGDGVAAGSSAVRAAGVGAAASWVSGAMVSSSRNTGASASGSSDCPGLLLQVALAWISATCTVAVLVK